VNKIRVRPMVPWPGKHVVGVRETPHIGSPGRPQDVWLILGPPVSPDRGWDCGTDVVWPVLEVENALPEFVLLGTPYVCRHQIQAGD
jgi:hypothetical protein